MNRLFGKNGLGLKMQKGVTVLVLALSWALLLWINFSADMSVALHLVAIPVLFLLTGALAAISLERDALEYV